MSRRETEYEDIDEVEEDDDDMRGNMDEDVDGMDEMDEMPNLFWSAQLKPDGETELEPPVIDGFVIHITKASFGATVKAGSRTVVLTKDDDKNEVPVCVLLEGKNESENLDLIISDGLTFHLKGKNVSPVSLTGYIAPPPRELDDHGGLSMDDEEMGDVDEVDDLPPQVKEAMKKRKLQQARQDDSNEAPELDDEEKEANEPPSKRAKIDNSNKNKPTQSQPQPPKKNVNNNATDNKKPVPEQTTTTTNNNSSSEVKQDNEKPLTKSQKKKQKQAAKNAAKNDGNNNPGNTTIVVNNNNPGNKTTIVVETKENDNDKDVNKDNENIDNKSPKSLPSQSPKEAVNKKNVVESDLYKGLTNKMKNGIRYKEIKEGDGQPIKPGQKIAVYYVGQLPDKQVFDKTITGEGFEFTFGKGEVIKGWDEGLKGMNVGGKRRLVVPANLGYGKEGTNNIPPNSELVFTVQVLRTL